jgi:hypothetical protein
VYQQQQQEEQQQQDAENLFLDPPFSRIKRARSNANTAYQENSQNTCLHFRFAFFKLRNLATLSDWVLCSGVWRFFVELEERSVIVVYGGGKI